MPTATSTIARLWVDEDPSPEQLFVAAFLHRAMADAVSEARSRRYDQGRVAQARAWLLQREEVLWWLTQINLDERIYRQMLRTVGLEEPPHG